MATDFDPYAILEVERSAGQDEIDRAYRRQWAAYPNDATPDARLREIQAAYRILSDPEERRAYDARLADRAADGVTWATEPELATSPAPTLHGDGPGRVPWSITDILKAIGLIIPLAIIPAIPFVLAAAIIAGDRSIDEDATALTLSLLASIFLELALLWGAWRFSVKKYQLNMGALGFRKPARGVFWLPFALFGGAMAVLIAYSQFLSLLGLEPDTDLPDAAFDNLIPYAVLVVLTLGMAPLMEETFFRGFFFKGVARRYGSVVGIIASGCLFGIVHAANPGGLYIVFPITAIGAIFAWGLYYSDSIYPGIIAHLAFNMLTVVSGFINAH